MVTGGAGWLDSPYRLLIRTSLVLAISAGFSLGLYLLLGFAFGLPLSAGTPALMQVHGQTQVLGFIALFIMGVAVQLFPRFHSSRLDRPAQVSLGGLLVGGGVVTRVVSQPLALDTAGRAPLLVLSGALELLGILLALHAFARVIRGGLVRPRGWQLVLPATLGSSLVLALVLNLATCVELAQGVVVVPSFQDEALVHLELWGFGSTMVLAVSSRIFPKFLLLQPTRDGWLRVALLLWALGALATPAVWLASGGAAVPRLVASLAQLAGAALFVAGLRLYETPVRESGMPHVTNPTRLWARLSYAMVLAGGAANVGLAGADVLGAPTNLTQLSAARHFVAQGFLLPMIVLMAARILPGYSGYMLYRRRLLAGMIWSLLVGAVLRSGAELVGGYSPGWNLAVATGGTLAVVAFGVFAVGLWRSTA